MKTKAIVTSLGLTLAVVVSLLFIFVRYYQSNSIPVLIENSPTKSCVIYPSQENVEIYQLAEKPHEYCAQCGDGICDYVEKCLPSSPVKTDCGGGLYCPKDCEK